MEWLSRLFSKQRSRSGSESGVASASPAARPEAATPKLVDIAQIRRLLGDIAKTRHRHFRGLSYYYTDTEKSYMESDPITTDALLGPEDLNLAASVGLTPELLVLAAHALSFESVNVRVGADSFRDVDITTLSDRALSRLCADKGPLSSYILHMVAMLTPVTVTLSACIGTCNFTFDPGERAKRAREELARRGYDGHDPLESPCTRTTGEGVA